MIKIAITGPESTGKSTLAEALGEYLGVKPIPEYAREYLENHQKKYTLDDVVNISEGQLRLIREKKLSDDSYLVADTEALVCKVWADYVFHQVPEKINKLLTEQQFDLYLLCNIDLPWTYDPLRENPNLDERKEIFGLYQRELEAMQANYVVISGSGEARLKMAVDAVRSI